MIEEAKQQLPLPDLMNRLGLGDHAKKSARCPFHDDRNNSFSVWLNDAGWFFKCHTGCGAGDEINFLEIHNGISRSDATKEFLRMAGGNGATIPPRVVTKPQQREPAADQFLSAEDCHRAIKMAETLRDTPGLCERIAKARNWKPETIRILTREPSLGWHEDKLAFIYETGVKLRWRQQGERIIKWAFGQTWLWRGSNIDMFRQIILTEGETDGITLIDAGLESDGETLIVAIPSASTFPERWASYFTGKNVTLAFDNDAAGKTATAKVSSILYPVVASLTKFDWERLRHAS